MKSKLVLTLFLVALTALVYGQSIDSIGTLFNTLLNPPNLKGQSLTQAFSTASTYIAAIIAFAVIYLAQWIPFVRELLAKIPSGYLRAIVVGGGALWAIVANSGIYDTQAIVAFVLSNVIWEILKNILPQTPIKQALNTETLA